MSMRLACLKMDPLEMPGLEQSMNVSQHMSARNHGDNELDT